MSATLIPDRRRPSAKPNVTKVEAGHRVMNIVHITPTPLVGAPGKIAEAQRMKGHNAIAVAFNDYPKGGPLERIFLDRTLQLNDFTRKYIEENIAAAEIIHIHNYVPTDRVAWLRDLARDADFVYQAHSPLREGPLYAGRFDSGAPFDYRAKLVVGQHWGRFYPTFQPVPNIILSTPSVRFRKVDEKLKVMFSPTHKHVGRWTSKFSQELNDSLSALVSLKKIELVSPNTPVPPDTLFEVRRSCHVSIDEIATGGFHMVSLEGLCAGNIVINRADYFAKATFGGFCEGSPPPFVYADGNSIGDVLLRLADDQEETVKLQKASYDYFSNYCAPTRLVEAFDAAYRTA